MKRNYFISSIFLGALGTLIALSSCSQNDPIREKERLIASGNIKKDNDDKNDKGKQEEPKKPDSPEEPKKPAEPEAPKTVYIETLHSFDLWKKIGDESSYSLPLISENEDITKSYWASASNAGYTILASSPESYPVVELVQGYKGSAAALRSIQGFYLFGMGTKLIAGSVYTGSVNSKSLASRPLESTLFGQAWTDGIPTELKLYYQYKSGEKIIHGQNGKVPTDIPTHDQGSISGVLYETTEDPSALNGNTVNNDPRIVARAYKLIDPSQPAKEWKELSLAFEPINKEAYDQIDFSKKKYALALIFSSSARGDKYIGAVGSELLIDEVKVISKK